MLTQFRLIQSVLLCGAILTSGCAKEKKPADSAGVHIALASHYLAVASSMGPDTKPRLSAAGKSAMAAGKALSASDKKLSPAGGKLAALGKDLSASGKALSPPAAAIALSPVGKDLSPADFAKLPGGKPTTR